VKRKENHRLYLIVGLGNPGRQYENTRHNLGFFVVQYLAKKFSLKLETSSLTKGFVAEGQWEGTRVYLLLPMTFMNNSGVAIKSIVVKKEIALENILVICDDLNLDFGQLRLRSKGGDGGHNGLSSVIQYLETEKFSRLRMGIDSPNGKKDVTDYVLEEFSKKEQNGLNDFIREAAECCLAWMRDGTNQAMEKYNRIRKENGKH